MSTINVDIFSQLFDNALVETKRCNKCYQDKPLGCFSKDSGANYLRSECKECAANQRKLLDEIKKNAPPVKEDHCCPGCKRNATKIANDNFIKNKKNNTFFITMF